MSNRDFKAIFEREQQPADNFGQQTSSWCEVAREWVNLDPVAMLAQRQEFVDGNQNKSTRKSIVDCCWSQTMAEVDVTCRMKLSRPNVVDESEPNSDVNFRFFHIESVVNVNEMNRELQFVVVESA